MAIDRTRIARIICGLDEDGDACNCGIDTDNRCPGADDLLAETDRIIKAVLDGLMDPSAEMWAAGANAVDRSKAFPGANVDNARATFFAMLAAERARLFPKETG